MKIAMEMKVWFNYDSLKQLLRNFFMTGITITEFDCLFEWVEPFLDTTTCPDSKDSKNSYHLRKQDKKTEPACPSPTCKRAPHLGVHWNNDCFDLKTRGKPRF